MAAYFKFFVFILFVSFCAPALDFPLYLARVDLVSLNKIPLVLLFVVALIFHVNHPLKVSSESVLFSIGGGVGLLLGVYRGQFYGSEFYTHLFCAVMPIFSMSFGRHLCQWLDGRIPAEFERVVEKVFYLQVIFILGFLYFYYIDGSWGYFGFGTGIGFASLCLLIAGKKALFALGVLLDFFSGKRAGVVVTIFVFIWITSIVRSWRGMFFFGFLIVAGVLFFSYQSNIFESGIFRRFEIIGQLDLDDAMSIFMATGGRLTEVISVVDYMNQNPVSWLAGAGFGGQYMFVDPRDGFYPEPFHYVHFSPFGYVFLFGLPFAIVLYTLIIWRAVGSPWLKNNFMYVGFLYLFGNSFFGSTMFIDPRIWVFYGMVIQLVGDPRPRSTEGLGGADVVRGVVNEVGIIRSRGRLG